MHIPIKSPEYFHNHYPDYTIIFHWNHFDEITKKEREYRNGTWVDQLPTLLEMKKANRSQQIDGANQCAAAIIRLLDNAT